jgi:hypothetical protein
MSDRNCDWKLEEAEKRICFYLPFGSARQLLAFCFARNDEDGQNYCVSQTELQLVLGNGRVLKKVWQWCCWDNAFEIPLCRLVEFLCQFAGIETPTLGLQPREIDSYIRQIRQSEYVYYEYNDLKRSASILYDEIQPKLKVMNMMFKEQQDACHEDLPAMLLEASCWCNLQAGNLTVDQGMWWKKDPKIVCLMKSVRHAKTFEYLYMESTKDGVIDVQMTRQMAIDKITESIGGDIRTMKRQSVLGLALFVPTESKCEFFVGGSANYVWSVKEQDWQDSLKLKSGTVLLTEAQPNLYTLKKAEDPALGDDYWLRRHKFY